MKCFFISLLMLASLPGFSLTDTSAVSNQPAVFGKRQIAAREIHKLKSGVLLVRLWTKENAINSLRKMGNNELADKIGREQKTLNKKIISSFRECFDFCPVYFFMSHYSEDIRQKQFSRVVFVNDSAEEDSLIRVTVNDFLVAEFSNIEQDTGMQRDNYYQYTGERGREQRTVYYSGPDLRMAALVVRSESFVQLRSPFPYYVRAYNSWPLRRKTKTVIRKFNKNLSSFYSEGKQESNEE